MADDEGVFRPLHDRPDDVPDETSRARRAVADALRDLCHALGASPAAPEPLLAVAAALREQHRIVATPAPTATPAAAAPGSFPGMHDFHDRSPIAGRANPLAPPATLGVDREAGVVVGEVTFGPAFEGAPGIAHGGFVAAVLDEALGMASALSGSACMTAELTTRYRRHTPIGVPLRIEARLDSTDRRKVLTSGEVYAGDEVIAEAHGLFISVGAEKFSALLEARGDHGEG